MLSLITPSFADLLLGLLIGFGAIVVLIVISQLLRQRSSHSIYSIGISIAAGLFIAVQAGLWLKADELIEEAERKAAMLNGVKDMVDNTVPTDSIANWMSEEVGEIVSAGKEGLFDLFSLYGADMIDRLRDFRNHRILWGGVAMALGLVLTMLAMGVGGRSGASRRVRPVGMHSSRGGRGRR